MQITRTLLILIIWTVAYGASVAGMPIATELLDKYTANQDRLNRSLIIKAECARQWDTNGTIDMNDVVPIEVRWDGERGLYLANYHLKDLNELQGPLDETNARYFILWDGERLIEYDDAPPNAPYPSEASIIDRKGSLDWVITQAINKTPLFGIRSYGGRDRIDRVLRGYKNLSVRDKMEAIGSDECYVVDANDAVSTWTVWLNPKHGYGIAQAFIHLGPGARVARGTWSAQEYCTYTLKDVEFREIDGTHVPVAYTQYEEIRDHAIGLRKATSRVKVTDIILNPDHEALGSFVLKMREGTKVSDRNFGLIYFWRGGKLVPDIDEVLVKEMDAMIESLQAQWQTPPGIRPQSALSPDTDNVHDNKSDKESAAPAVTTGKSGGERPASFPLVPAVLVGCVAVGVVVWLVARKARG